MEARNENKDEKLCVLEKERDEDDDGMVGWWDGGMRGGKRKRVMEKRLHKER